MKLSNGVELKESELILTGIMRIIFDLIACITLLNNLHLSILFGLPIFIVFDEIGCYLWRIMIARMNPIDAISTKKYKELVKK